MALVRIQCRQRQQHAVRPAKADLACVLAPATARRQDIILLDQLRILLVAGNVACHPARRDLMRQIVMSVLAQANHSDPLQRSPSIRRIPLMPAVHQRRRFINDRLLHGNSSPAQLGTCLPHTDNRYKSAEEAECSKEIKAALKAAGCVLDIADNRRRDATGQDA